jgi:DNA-binding NtrC family response regulator
MRRRDRSVGSDRWTRVNVRVIAATRRNLDQEIQAGRFRDDLFFRLAVARVELPPLRRRTGDIALLARHFWRTYAGEGSAPDDFVRRLESYDWPGNVRELHNAVVRRLSLGDLDPVLGFGERDESGALPSAPPTSASSAPRASDAFEEILSRDLPFPRARDEALGEFERRYVERLLARYAGSVTRAAAASGIALRYFQRIRARQARRKD